MFCRAKSFSQTGCSNDMWFLGNNGLAGLWIGTEEDGDARAFGGSVRRMKKFVLVL